MSSDTTTTSWGDTKTVTSAALTAIILEGKLTHVWELPYGGGDQRVEVVYDLFAVGTRIDIEVRTSGLDGGAKRALGDLFTVAHALRSVGGSTFNGGAIDEKIAFLRSLSEPVWALFLEQHQSAYLKQIQEFEKRRELLGKPTPDRR